MRLFNICPHVVCLWLAWRYSHQLVRFNNMPVMVSSPE